MLQQSVTDDVNEYYWAVEAEGDLVDESEAVLAASGEEAVADWDELKAKCAEYAAYPNPDDPAEGLWPWEHGGSTEYYQCQYKWRGANGYVEEYFDERQCFSAMVMIPGS